MSDKVNVELILSIIKIVTINVVKMSHPAMHYYTQVLLVLVSFEHVFFFGKFITGSNNRQYLVGRGSGAWR